MIPDKRYFRIGEVSRITGLEPHVIRYWEREFSQLAPVRADSRQRLYTRQDLRLILRIRILLHEERYTIAGAKKRLSGPALSSKVAPEPEPPHLPEPPAETGGQQELPLFPDEPAPQPLSEYPPEEDDDLLGMVRLELVQIIKVLT